MAWAAVADVEALLGQTVDVDRTEYLLDMATEMVQTWAAGRLDPMPAEAPMGVPPIVAAMVARVITNPLGLSGEQAGVYSYQRPGVQGLGLYVTPQEVAALDLLIPGARVGSVYSVRTPSDWLADDEWYDESVEPWRRRVR